MSKINVLSFEIANLIAAGEVVERPSSVLKELIENSIDSGATKIVAEIKRGGVALIRVSDNGCGIDKDDLPIALKRHATSKIKDRDDLETIMTLGFRGEALAAISSVSEMTIISKTKDAPSATMLTAEGGRVVDITEVGAADGTTVVVENLFGNVPARRKFLKKDSTEAMNVSALVEKVAVSHPEISIQLLIDGEQRFNTPGDGDLYNAIYAVFGKDFASKLIKAEGIANGIKVSGYIGRSDNAKRNRNYQNVFINGRYVKSMTAMAAIEKAYTSYIAPECFPVCVLFLEMNPRVVDVNVHPAKLEVKFSDERAVFESVYYTVKNALEEHEYRPEITLGTKKNATQNPLAPFVPVGTDTKGEQIKMTAAEFRAEIGKTSASVSAVKETRKSEITSDFDKPLMVSNGLGGYVRENKPKYTPTADFTMTPKDSVELLNRYRSVRAEEPLKKQDVSLPTPLKTVEAAPSYKIIGEAFDCYVMVEQEDSLLVIDKHAAHERIIFEDLKRSRNEDSRVSSQTLLLPLTVVLTPDELAAVGDFSDDIRSVGFEFCINENAVDITAIPGAIGLSDAEGLFVKMADELFEGRGNPKITEDIRREKALYQIACKAAIKGGRVYDKALIEWLVKKVLLLPDITVCPHGRPIAYKLTKKELDRQFDRIK